MILQGFVTDQSGNGFSGWLTGCLPAGALAHTVISARLRTRDTGTAGQVRALDAAGHVVAIGTVDRHPVAGVPLQPR